jgi:hypothetical protein
MATIFSSDASDKTIFKSPQSFALIAAIISLKSL